MAVTAPTAPTAQTGADDPLERRVAVGQIVKLWLCLGPFYEDVSARVQGLTLFERAGATTGATAMDEIVAAAAPLLASAPREGELAQFRQHTGMWTLARRPEEYLSWGTYHIANHL